MPYIQDSNGKHRRNVRYKKEPKGNSRIKNTIFEEKNTLDVINGWLVAEKENLKLKTKQ